MDRELALWAPLQEILGSIGLLTTYYQSREDRDRARSQWPALVDTLAKVTQVALRKDELATMLSAVSLGAKPADYYAAFELSSNEMIWLGSRDPCQHFHIVQHRRDLEAFFESECTSKVTHSSYFPRRTSFGRVVSTIPRTTLHGLYDNGVGIVAFDLEERERSSAESQLSERETQVERMLTMGYSVLNIASVLSVTENTVRTYVRRIY